MAAPRPWARAGGASVPDDVMVAGKGQRAWIHEDVAGRRWRISSASFFQNRPDGAAALSELVGAAVPAGAQTAVDLYSGVGLFAGLLAERGLDVVAVERHGAAVSDARHNLRDLDVKLVRADVARWRPHAVDLVVADPGREGLGRVAAKAVATTNAARVVLVSCDAASLARDVSLLAEHGYTLTSVTPVDLFPHTAHVEAVSILDRATV